MLLMHNSSKARRAAIAGYSGYFSRIGSVAAFGVWNHNASGADIPVLHASIPLWLHNENNRDHAAGDVNFNSHPMTLAEIALDFRYRPQHDNTWYDRSIHSLPRLSLLGRCAAVALFLFTLLDVQALTAAGILRICNGATPARRYWNSSQLKPSRQ